MRRRGRVRRFYIYANKVIGRHVLAEDCWCGPRVEFVPYRPTDRPS